MLARIAPVALAAAAAVMGGCTDYDVDTPDTAANRKGFERHFKLEPDEDVAQVYYYADELGADVRYQLSFRCGRETIDEIISRLSLAEAPEDHGGLAPRDDLTWWKPDSTSGRSHWVKERRNEHFWELWYSAEDGKAYYHEYSM